MEIRNFDYRIFVVEMEGVGSCFQSVKLKSHNTIERERKINTYRKEGDRQKGR